MLGYQYLQLQYFVKQKNVAFVVNYNKCSIISYTLNITQLLHQPLQIYKIYNYLIYNLYFNVSMRKFYKCYICAVVGVIIE